jgi:hypothetical protein
MSLIDLLRQDYVKGRVIDKYRLDNGNDGLVVEDGATSKRYHVEFKDNGKGAGIENLFGLLNDPFSGKTEHVDRLSKEGDAIELTVSYSKGPLREACFIHSAYGPKENINRAKMFYSPYRSVQMSGY